MEIIILVIGLIVGLLIGFLIAKLMSKNTEGTNNLLKENIGKLDQENDKLKSTEIELNKKLSTENSENLNLQKRLQEQKEEIENLQKKFAQEFENLANRIFDEKSSKFTQQNRDNIDQILKPLGERIKLFENRINEVYTDETKQRASLAEQIKNLNDLNQQMSKDATNLTNALKGESKTQGNWGEFILESILEKSGLVKDREYSVQSTFTGEEGKRQKPDVIINLPENLHIIIDSKVSLTAYEQFCSIEDETLRKVSLNDHINSIRNHVKELSKKNYQNIYDLSSMDFVIMFVPIEPAMAIASQADINIWNDAFEKNIVIVSPSILLATLRTIANIWKQESQNKNALEIARQSGALYDKFVSFVDDLISIGKKIDDTKEHYSEAMKKLYDGSGNIVRRIENLKLLGAKATKSINQNLLDKSSSEEIEEIK
ncbi:MAG: DNA recombination protein RmuC [Ignavibacteriae bacterium]|nr:DNA recombination protein RmuC [Ignavibacteriota bacterium]